MAMEDETREAADGTEVQVEAVDLGTVHFEAHPEVKLPSIMEIKNVGEAIDSTAGTLEIPEDQVLVEAPSELELPPEHKLNGEASSPNGHMDKEEKISNAQLHENDQEEAELEGTSAHQSNGINKEEVTDGLSHGESTTEHSSLLKHEKDEEPRDDRQDSEGVTVDDDLVQEDTLQPDNSIEQTDDGQRDQNQEPEKANEGTQPASIANNADIEEAEAPTGFQTPVEPHMDDSGAVPVTIDEKIEMEEPAKADDVVHPDHKESFPEETSIAGPTEEVAKMEDPQSQQADAVDADVVQEEVPKFEHADEPATNAHEVLNQESTEETDGPVNEKTEETAHQSNMAVPEETTPENDTITGEPPATMTNIPDVEVVSEAPSGVQTPVEINLDNSDAIPDTAGRNTETDESAKAEGTTAISEPQMTETEEEPKDIEATEAQEITEHGHVTPSKELSAEDDSTADETHNDDIQHTLGQDSVEVKETVFTSEDTVLDNVTAEEPTCDSQEVDNAESTEETKGNTAENIEEVSDVVIADEAVKEQDVLQTEDIAETHMQELEPEETKNTEPVESEEASDQMNAVLFDDLAQEDTQEIDMQQAESATETTETEAAPQESKDCVSDEPLEESLAKATWYLLGSRLKKTMSRSEGNIL